MARLVAPDVEPGPDIVDLGPLLRGVCEAWLARTGDTEPVAETYPHPRVRTLDLVLADLDLDSFRLRGHLVPAGDWPDGDRLVLVDRLGEHAVEHGLASPGYARQHADGATNNGTTGTSPTPGSCPPPPPWRPASGSTCCTWPPAASAP